MAPPSSSTHAKPPRVLVINDEVDFRILLFQLIAVEWPDAVVEEWEPALRGDIRGKVDLANVDVVLLDSNLSNADALTWIKLLRSDIRCPPIIVILAQRDQAVEAAARDAGAFNCLHRSGLTQEHIVQAIRRILEKPADMDEDPYVRTVPLAGMAPGAVVESTGSAAYATAAGNVEIKGYRMIRRIRVGGMSAVFLAERISDGQQLVMKILDGRLSESNEFLMRFIREHSLISNIKNTHIVRIFDQGFTDRHVYIAMEYFARGDLRERIKAQKLDASHAIRLLTDIAKALGAIHEEHIVHRDLKPENIMFRDDDSLALVDFGIAMQSTESSVLTLDGLVMGTPYYISPEQATGNQPVDGRTDLYSAGVILFELLTGKRPYTAPNTAALLEKHLSEPIPRLPGPLARYQELIDRLMAKKPEHRFASARALIDYLEALRQA